MIDESQFSLSTEQRLKAKKDALNKYTNIAQPALQDTQNKQLGQAFGQIRSQVGNLAEEGGLDARQKTKELLGKSAKGLAELQGQQELEKTKGNIQGAMMEEDLIKSRQVENIQAFVRDTEKAQYEAGEAVARKAFDAGMDTKRLLMSNDAIVADAALNKMKEDFQAGRINKDEMVQVQAALQKNAQELKNAFETELAQLQADLQKALSEKDLQALEARQERVLKLMEEALKDEAKASNIGTIISSIGGVVSAINPVWGGIISAADGLVNYIGGK